MELTTQVKQAYLKSTELDRIKIALNFYNKHRGSLVDACLNFGVSFADVFKELETQRIEFNRTKRPEERIPKTSLRDYALEFMKENPDVSAYKAAKEVGLKTEKSITDFLLALDFYKTHKGSLVDACVRFGIPFAELYKELETQRKELNRTKRPDEKIRKVSLRDHALEYMKENPEVSAYKAARHVGLKTEASITNFLRAKFKSAGKHLIPCGSCGRLPSPVSKGRNLSDESLIAQAQAWKEANGTSDYEASNHFGLANKSSLSVYRKRMSKRAQRCQECHQSLEGS